MDTPSGESRQQYGGQGADKPNDKNSPVDKANGGNTTVTGKCQCPDWPRKDQQQSIMRLLKELEEELEASTYGPGEATKKFGDDLKECEKEYQGLTDLVTKYKDFYNKLDCSVTEANKQRDEVRTWAKDTSNAADILSSWRNNYEAKDTKICCDWIKLKYEQKSMRDCLRQAEENEGEIKEDYEALKNVEKTFKERLADLKFLYDKGRSLKDASRHAAAYAFGIEFCSAFNKVGLIQTWAEKRRKCVAQAKPGQGSQDQTAPGQTAQKQNSPKSGQEGETSPCDQSPEDGLDKVFKETWTPEKYQAALTSALRELINAKYQRFRWHQLWLTKEDQSKKRKEACDKFRKTRRDDFSREAEELEPAKK